MNKNDKEKIDSYVEQITKSYVYCFNREATDRYLKHKVESIYDSCVYNNEFVKMRLDLLEKEGISDTREGFGNKKVAQEIHSYFCNELREKIKNELPIHFAELDKQKKKEKESEKESKKK